MAHAETSLPLPLVPEGTPIAWSRQEIQALSHAPGDTAHRRTMLFSIGFDSLDTVLRDADVMFDEIAGYCEAKVPWHQWKLAPRPENPDFSPSDDPLLPTGYELVAEVELLKDVEPLTTDERIIVRNGVSAYRRSNPPSDWLGDPDRSFVRAIRRNNGAPRLWLPDFEPRILSRKVPPSQW